MATSGKQRSNQSSVMIVRKWGRYKVGSRRKSQKNIQSIKEALSMIRSNKHPNQLKGVMYIWTLISVPQPDPINVQQIIKSNIIVDLMHIIEWHTPTKTSDIHKNKRLRNGGHTDDLRLHISNILVNVSGQQLKNGIIDAKMYYILIDLLKYPNGEIVSNIVWIIGNIMGNGIKYRNEILSNHKFLPYLLNILDIYIEINQNYQNMVHNLTKSQTLNQSNPINSIIMSREFLEIVVWTLSNICRGRPLPPEQIIEEILPYLCKLIHYQSDGIIKNVLWAISYLTDVRVNKRLNCITQDKLLLKRVIECLNHPILMISNASLKIMGNIATGDDVQTQSILDMGVFTNIFNLIKNTKDNAIRKEAIWFVSNIAAGNETQRNNLIDETTSIFPLFYQFLLQDTISLEIKREIIFTVGNFCQAERAYGDCIYPIIELNYVSRFCDFLDPKYSSRVQEIVFETLINVLEPAPSFNARYKMLLIKQLEEGKISQRLKVLNEVLKKTPGANSSIIKIITKYESLTGMVHDDTSDQKQNNESN